MRTSEEPAHCRQAFAMEGRDGEALLMGHVHRLHNQLRAAWVRERQLEEKYEQQVSAFYSLLRNPLSSSIHCCACTTPKKRRYPQFLVSEVFNSFLRIHGSMSGHSPVFYLGRVRHSWSVPGFFQPICLRIPYLARATLRDGRMGSRLNRPSDA